MNLNQVKNYTKGVLQGWFLNKPALDKISESDDGKILYNNKELDVTEQVASIKKYQKYLNTELDYCYAYTTYTNNLNYTSSSVPFVIPFESYDSNMSINNTEHSILLKANKKYNVQYSSRIGGSANIQAGFSIYDEHNNELIKTWAIDATGTCDNTWDGKCINAILCVTEDTKIFVKCSTITGTINSLQCDLSITEIGRQITIDPVEYINESQGLEDTPVGHIISHMGTIAPKHYLICNGAEYNISDYPYLAQHIIDSFGSVNYFGGDGVTTFAVPDLRGEFLRGTGTATRNTGSGGEVGEHQDGTAIPSIYSNASKISIASINLSPSNMDMLNKAVTQGLTVAANDLSSAERSQTYTARPTNTSVLYCIKYEPTYFMQQNNPLVGKGETVLWEGNLNINGETVTLNDNINNYNEFQIQIKWNNGGAYANLPIYTINDIKDSQEADCSIFATLYGICYVEFKMHENVFEVIAVSSTIPLAFSKIMGIKYAKLPEDIELTQEQIQAAIDEDAF